MNIKQEFLSKAHQANINCKYCDKLHKKIHGNNHICYECSTRDIQETNCSFCGEITYYMVNEPKRCSNFCKHEDMVEGYDYLKCPVTGEIKLEITLGYVKMLGFTTIQEYLDKFGFKKAKCQKVIDKMQEKNPWKNHGGKFSPFSKDSVNYDPEVFERAKKTKIENNSDSTKLSYWLEKSNGDEELAREMLAERQSTFSLQKCIKKHGEEKGREIWQARQDKWRGALDKLSDDLKEEINSKKGTKLNREYRDKNIDNIPGRIYYIRVYDEEIEFWKIGITSKDLRNRLTTLGFGKCSLNVEVLFDMPLKSFLDCYNFEQYILNQYKEKRIAIRHKGFYSTECFSEDVKVEEEFNLF